MTDFQIMYFDEIEDQYQVTLLFQLGLSFSAMPKLLTEMRINDDRYTPEFGIFAVTKDGTVAAGHLLMRIATETTKGRLNVGGVNAVATRPEFGRRGIMSAVMNKTHQYFERLGLEYSVLTTSARLGATMMYEQLGYLELKRSQIAVKYPNQRRIPVQSDALVRSFSEEDIPAISRVFGKAVAGSYGFVHRPANFLKARNYTMGREINLKDNLRIVERAGVPTGYAYWDPNPLISEAYEIIALDQDSFNALLADAEKRNANTCIWVWCDGLTNLEIRWLKEAGYHAPIEAYGRAVIKPLKAKANSNELKALYGAESGNFRLGVWDGT